MGPAAGRRQMLRRFAADTIAEATATFAAAAVGPAAAAPNLSVCSGSGNGTIAADAKCVGEK